MWLALGKEDDRACGAILHAARPGGVLSPAGACT